MYIINERFEWDGEKARRNALKHGISFKEAATVFHDPEGMIAEDPAHSQHERRQWIVGESVEDRVLVVVFTIREGAIVRIISARPAGQRERNSYEKNQGISI